MKPLFNKNLQLVGWLDPGNHIFDTQMNWIACISKNHIWSSETENWLGPIRGATCYDKLGKPIAWNPKDFPSGIAKPRKPRKTVKQKAPMEPMKPLNPKTPQRPLRPMGGWSKLSWEEWLNQ